MLGLCAVLMAVEDPPRPVHLILTGFFAALCFLSYNGYWTIALFAMLAGLLHSERSLRLSRLIEKGLLIALGFSVLAAILLTINAFSELNVFYEMYKFSFSVYNGDYAEGWSLPFVYLWHAEHFMLVLWTLTLLGGLAWAVRGGQVSRRFLFAAAGVLFIYLSLVVFSVFFHRFVVYGRLVRQAVPFLCLGTAYVLARLRATLPDRSRVPAFVALLILLQVGLNWYAPLTQQFPIEFRARANSYIDARGGVFEFLYADRIYPTPAPPPAWPFEVMYAAPHPLQFKPYLYEGYNPEERQAVEAADITMRLIWHESDD
jgi:hypothetical protein